MNDYASCIYRGLPTEDGIPCRKTGKCDHQVTEQRLGAQKMCGWKGSGKKKPCKTCGFMLPEEATTCSYCGQRQ